MAGVLPGTVTQTRPRLMLVQAGLRTDLVLKCSGNSITLTELSLFLQHPRDVLPPSRLPIVDDTAGLRQHFLMSHFKPRAVHLQHACGSEWLVFGFLHEFLRRVWTDRPHY